MSTNDPTRNAFQARPEQDSLYDGTYVKSAPHSPKIRVCAADRQPVIPCDMQPPIKLTGQWRHDGYRYHLFINHAGPHLQMLIALVENGKSGKGKDLPRDKVRAATRLARIGGDRDSGDLTLYHLYFQHANDPVTSDIPCGTLRYSSSGKRLTLELDASSLEPNLQIRPKLAALGSTVATRFGASPNLFENHVGQAWISAEVRSRLWFPLTLKQIARLPGFLFSARIIAREDNFLREEGGPQKQFGYVDLLRAYYFTAQDDSLSSSAKRSRLRNAAALLDQLVFEVWNAALLLGAEQGGIDSFHADAWRRATLESLADNHITVAGHPTQKSLLTLTQTILDASHGLFYPNFEAYLHLQARSGGHYYAAEIDLVDVDASPSATRDLEKILKKVSKKYAAQIAKRLKRRIPAGSLLGLLEIRKQDDPDENPDAGAKAPEWIGYYAIGLVGYQRDISVGGGTAVIHSTGHAKHVYGQTWQPEQLDGVATFFDLGVSIFGGGGGTGKSLTVLSCYGSGSGKPPTPLQIDFSGVADIIGGKPGASAAFSGFVGGLIYIDSTTRDEEIEAPPHDAPFMYGSQSAAGPLHFRINQACLWPDGEHLLQAFGATELAILSQKGVSLTIDGYADQPDDDFNNMILSRNRAITVFNYLKNIMGDDLAIDALKQPPDETSEYLEKKEAERKGEEYKVVIPKHDHVKITAHGEPKPIPGEKANAKPEYNQEFRRVDLSVDGMVRLGLRRKDDGLGH